MNLNSIFVLAARFVKAERRASARLEAWCWYRLERLALWTLARSTRAIAAAGRRIPGEFRARVARRWISRRRTVSSDALHKAPVVRMTPWVSTADRN